MTDRAAGLLAHVSSLPGRFGIGDLGPATVRFLDWAAEAGHSTWQILPTSPTGGSRSPYAALASHAGNPLLISPEMLVREGLASADSALDAPGFPAGWVDFESVATWKRAILGESWKRFHAAAGRAAIERFDAFVEHPDQAGWLEEWVTFAALRSRFGNRHWLHWTHEFAQRDRKALRAVGRECGEEIAVQRYAQFVFFDQWESLHREASARGIRLLGDLPFYVAGDSADAWSRRDLFETDESGRPLRVAGVPPDYFSEDGQLWGNPLYRWKTMERDGFAWWIDRVRAALRLVDLLRLDHFRAFAAYWAVDATAPTAAAGQWIAGPGRALFDRCRDALGHLPFVAEDLGSITPDVGELRQQLGLPGMRVLQFALGEDGADHLPENHPVDCVAYTGTHDNDTLRGWFDGRSAADRRRALRMLRANERDVVRRAVSAVHESAASLAVIPLQDVFELGSEARMNRPGTPAGNWGWRAEASALTMSRARRLRRLAESSGRA